MFKYELIIVFIIYIFLSLFAIAELVKLSDGECPGSSSVRLQ